MKTEYAFAENINGTEQTGIIEIYGMKLICFCDKEQSKIILPALSSSLQNRSLVEENERLKKALLDSSALIKKMPVKFVNIHPVMKVILKALALSYKEETKNG